MSRISEIKPGKKYELSYDNPPNFEKFDNFDLFTKEGENYVNFIHKEEGISLKFQFFYWNEGYNNSTVLKENQTVFSMPFSGCWMGYCEKDGIEIVTHIHTDQNNPRNPTGTKKAWNDFIKNWTVSCAFDPCNRCTNEDIRECTIVGAYEEGKFYTLLFKDSNSGEVVELIDVRAANESKIVQAIPI